MIRRILSYITLILTLTVVLHSELRAQVSDLKSSDLKSSTDTVRQTNNIDLRNYKFLNTYILNQYANYNINFGRSSFSLTEYYNGRTVINDQNYVEKVPIYRNDTIIGYKDVAKSRRLIGNTDEVSLGSEYKYGIADNYNLVAEANWMNYSGPVAVELNKSQKLNMAIGMDYLFANRSFLGFRSGYESNSLTGETANGLIIKSAGRLTELMFEDFRLSADMKTDFANLLPAGLRDNKRQYSTIDLNGSLYRFFDARNSLRLNAAYRRNGSDIISSIGYDSSGRLRPLERRSEGLFSSSLDVNYSLIKELSGSVRLTADNLSVEKYFNTYLPTVSKTGVTLSPSDLRLSLNMDMLLDLGTFRQTAGLYLVSENQENIIRAKYSIADKDLADLQKIQSQLDFASSTTQLLSRTEAELSQSDSIKLNALVSIYRYDTPSKLNNDDKDLFTSIISPYYRHRINENLSFSLACDINLIHMVYLMKEKSALNFWNRIYKLRPSVRWQTGYFSMNPQFELLANYTIWDFVKTVKNRQSESYRQIAYRDSICIFITKKYSLQNSIYIRYFETGELYWDEFRESPLTGNGEYSYKTLLVADSKDWWTLGCGLRYYSYVVRDLVYNTNNQRQISAGPETFFKINLPSGSSILFQGWYEIQTGTTGEKRYIPNFSLFANIKI